jgi:iron-sulfur cluster insertion protein
MAAHVELTAAAAARVQTLIKMEDKPNMMLRVEIASGGCSGFQYGIRLDDAVGDTDTVFAQHDVNLVIDETSLEMLDGSVVDFVSDMMGASFQIRNPNATSSCGCGSSFSV